MSKCQTAKSVGKSRGNTKNELLASGKKKKTIKTPKILRASFFDKSSFGHRPLFKNEQFGEIRTIIKDNEPWFVGKDVATVLGYKDAPNAICKHVDEEDKTSLVICQSGSNYKAKTTIINESGLYSLILFSKLPQAKEFKRWVTSEVLPQIRTAYSIQVRRFIFMIFLQ